MPLLEGGLMFRLSKLKPPNGWSRIAWELAIVTLGVLLALAAQQLMESRTLRAKVEASKIAIREELALHYALAVEFRTVHPCMKAQLSRLRNRVLSSGSVLDPVPIYSEAPFQYVVRMPSKTYRTGAWDATVNDGLVQRLDPDLRQLLGAHYSQIVLIRNLSEANSLAELGFAALTQRLTLDPAVKFGIVKEVAQVGGQLDYLDLLQGQAIGFIKSVGMLPPPQDARTMTVQYGTYKFCTAQGLPMRSFEEAEKPLL